ncbi:MAG TPA: permease [Chloroflexota bacterium]|nr:permease [Chloroflexota bacterium]
MSAILQTPSVRNRRNEYVLGFGLLLVIAVVGLYIAKWSPYYNRSLTILSTHAYPGSSIVSGKEAAPPAPSFQAALSYAQAYFLAIWQALVVGLLLGATLETVVPRDWMARVFGSSKFRASFLGGLFALPGMMCTCCSAPVVTGLRKSGASAGSATAFFLGNPALNPAVIVFLLLAVGWQWALLRAVMAIILVFGTAAIVGRMAPGNLLQLQKVEELPTDTAAPSQSGPWILRWLQALARLTFTLAPAYVVMILILGGVRAFLFPAAGPQLGNNLLWIIVLAITGTIFAIPTAGEIPIITAMRGFGVGAGPAGALLMTLAPVSLVSLVLVAPVFPKRVLLVIALCVVAVGILSGLVALALGL